MDGRAQRDLRIVTDGGVVVCERCELADGTLSRMRGLLGREALEPGTGMLLSREPSVHTFFMRFPIDVVFLDKAKTIVKIVHDLRPWRAAGARKAVAALELPAGAAASAGLRTGMTLVVSPIEELDTTGAAA
jgi:uncharacterized membrane protein (UPF0127 family)